MTAAQLPESGLGVVSASDAPARPGSLPRRRFAERLSAALRIAVLMLVATLSAMAIGEVALRLLDQSYYWAVSKRPDALRGWRPAPNVAAWQRFEGQALVRTNQLGFRDRDHDPTAAPGVLRVAVLGDSFTAAVQVPIEQTWWRIMEARLNAMDCMPGGRFEAQSFAVSGYSTAQSLLAWRSIAAAYKPDAVVLAFFVGNDLNENTPLLDHDPLRPYLRLDDQGQLVVDDRFHASPEYRFKQSWLGRGIDWLMVRSRILQTLVQVRHVWRTQHPAKPDVRTANPKAVGEPAPAVAQGRNEPHEPGVDNGIFRPPTDPAWQDAWAVTKAMLTAFANEVRATGARPLLMVIGTGAQVHPNARARQQFATAIGVEDLGYPLRRLSAIAADVGLPVLNLPALMAPAAEQQGRPLYGFDNAIRGFGHWNADGHQSAGTEAAMAICTLLTNPADVPAGTNTAP